MARDIYLYLHTYVYLYTDMDKDICTYTYGIGNVAHLRGAYERLHGVQGCMLGLQLRTSDVKLKAKGKWEA